MGQRYSQLTEGERNQIYALRKAGHEVRSIAEQLGRAPSTVCRELRPITTTSTLWATGISREFSATVAAPYAVVAPAIRILSVTRALKFGIPFSLAATLSGIYLPTGVSLKCLTVSPLFGTLHVKSSVFLPSFNMTATGLVSFHMPHV